MSSSHISKISSRKFPRFTLGSLPLNSCLLSRWTLKAIPYLPQYSMALIIEEIYALFFSTKSVEALVNKWSAYLYGFWKQEKKLFNASVKSLWYCSTAWWLRSDRAPFQFRYGGKINNLALDSWCVAIGKSMQVRQNKPSKDFE